MLHKYYTRVITDDEAKMMTREGLTVTGCELWVA